ncbi:MAG: TlyA family RNA methyltransferase [Gemmatimonadetes bacterium]|nr:TlyA family RNA methyltransferase [Gemmatimonadota bacterium]
MRRYDGRCSTADTAARIASGVRWNDGSRWKPVAKNGDELPASAPVELVDSAQTRYVSRGGLKLEGGVRAGGIDPAGLRCLDVGQSTGGFTDCLLQHGAAQVVGVDVGHGQLHPSLRQDARVFCLEKVNARHLSAAELPSGAGFDLVVGDLSFISLTLVLPALVPLLADDGDLLMLAKPQFELQPGQLGKGGLVRDGSLYAVVEQRLRGAIAGVGLAVQGWYDSPITGGDGNREFFIHATRKSA